MPKKKAGNETLKALRGAAHDDRKAVEFIEHRRWQGKASCPYCFTRNVYAMKKRGTDERNKDYRWRCRQCNKQFTVRTGTVMEESRLPLRIWCYALWRMAASKKGISALQLSREVEITHKSALFLLHRLRHAVSEPERPGPMYGDVEIDEAYIGGKPRMRNRKNMGQYHNTHEAVVAMVERGGRVRVRHPKSEPGRRIGKKQIEALMLTNIDLSARIFTDESNPYKGVSKHYADHQTVNHKQREYVREEATTNTVEGFFSLLKRGIYGTFHSVSPEHLHLYLAEFEFRYNQRNVDDGARAVAALVAGERKRLRYNDHVVRKAS